MSNIGEKIKCRKCNGEGSYRSSFSPGLRRPPNIPCELCKGSGIEPLTSTEGNREQAEDDLALTWLARNVPLEQVRGWVQKVGEGFNIVTGGMPPAILGQPMWFSAREVLARRAELQNKPGWGSVGSEINYISQHEDGQWIGHSEKPDEGDKCFECDCIISLFGYGEVLGDWRDTLERRPESTRAEMEVELVKAAFQPFTSIEDNQEQDVAPQQEMKQDSGWFELGELPPVGTVCEYTLGANAPWYQCEIKYVIRGSGVVMKRIPYGGEQYCGLLHRNAVSFRPIRTEREAAIEEMCNAAGLDGLVFGLVAGRLYDAGYRKESK